MAECNVQFGEVTEIDRIPCIIFECDKITEIIVYPNERILARLKIQGEAGGWFKAETSYDLTFEFSEEEMELTTSSWSVERGDVILTNITAKKAGDFLITTKMNGKETGRIKVVSKEKDKDIFTEAEKDSLIAENQSSMSNHVLCYVAVDKQFSEVVDENLELTSYAGLSGYDRAEDYGSKGYVFSNKRFAQSEIWRRDNRDGYDLVPVGFRDNKETVFSDYINQGVNNKPGYHFYYFVLLDAYHVLTLIIDNTNACEIKFKAIDQIRDRVWQGLGELNTFMFEITQNNYSGASDSASRKDHDSSIQLWKLQNN